MKLPAKVWSQLGTLPVTLEKMPTREGHEMADFGEFFPHKREIVVNSDSAGTTQLATLFHEMTHVALWDAGGANVMSDAQTEFVCDALGSYLAGCVFAGFLRLHVPKE